MTRSKLSSGRTRVCLNAAVNATTKARCLARKGLGSSKGACCAAALYSLEVLTGVSKHTCHDLWQRPRIRMALRPGSMNPGACSSARTFCRGASSCTYAMHSRPGKSCCPVKSCAYP